MTSADSDERARASFLRGLTLGAIVGAIIAGSSLWTRRRRRHRRERPAGTPGTVNG
jgi:hypothetical protein